jgi:FtsP/CotA-like multicopper oxidase with cupredoxin domain
VDPQPRGPDWMQITPKAGSLFHAYSHANPPPPFPSVTLRIDFRGHDIGDFVFHCHILGHEDLGMMNIIRVQAP